MSEEKVYLNKGEMKVTSSRIQIERKTYATKHITSVEMGSREPNRAIPVILGLVSLLVFLCGIAGVYRVTVTIILGAAALALTYFVYRGQSVQYIVKMSSSSGEVTALKTPDEGVVIEIVTAIQQAITEE